MVVMSKSKKVKIICSNCGAEIEFTVYDSINARLNPELKQKLIDDTLYKVECSCGAKLKEIYSLLYHDPDKKFMVYGVHPDSLFKVVQTFDVMREKYPKEYDGYTLRAVSSPTDLREKVIILNAGLDDRVIEIYKRLDIEGINQMQPDANATKGYFYIENDKNIIEYNTSFYLSKEITSENYEFIKNFYVGEITASENSYIIDGDWANSVINDEIDFDEEGISDDLKELIKSVYEDEE